MPAPTSAALLVMRRTAGAAEFLLAHPGGPFWKAKDLGAWSLPKGLIEAGEDSAAAALREFQEEVGIPLSGELTPRKQRSGKLIEAFALEADLDLTLFQSNLFELEWPRGSGRIVRFPEIDRVAYFPMTTALEKINQGQRPFLIEATEKLAGR